ncbi:MAG: hypothetical protein DRI61_07075 [Chloroflexi bacterium]|nr:MAG: hypothetical protein DRI61_07075 [Chloroflexota bacterium]
MSEGKVVVFKSGLIEAFKIKDFRALWLGQFISQMGDNFALIAALVVIQTLSGSPVWLGIAAMAMTLPQLVFGLIGGVFVDRFNRKRVMIISDLLRGAAILILVTVRSPRELYLLPLVGCFMSTIGVFFNPARNAVLPNIVSKEMLLTANGLIQASQMLAVIVGSSLASIIIAVAGPAAAFVLDSFTFIVSAIAIASMNIPPLANSDSPKGVFWPHLKEGFSYIKKHRTIQVILLTASLATLGIGSIAVLGVAYVEKELGVEAESFGFLNSVQGIGMVVGGFLLSFLSKIVDPGHLTGVAMGILGIAILIFAFSPRFELALAAAAIIGLGVVTARATLAALLQALVPDEKRGRLESTVNTCVSFSTTTAMGFSGLLGAAIGVKTVFVLAALTTMAGGALATLFLKQPPKGKVREQLEGD